MQRVSGAVAAYKARDSLSNEQRNHSGFYFLIRHRQIVKACVHGMQVNFMDHTEVILSADQRLVTYTDKTGARVSYQMEAVFAHCPSPELFRRIKYTKEILNHMVATGKS